MRSLFTFFLCTLVLLSACKKTTPTASIPDGTYTGTFQRQTASGGNLAPVSLTFAGGTWTGEGQVSKYPALCNGTYTVTGNKITFENKCMWTAEFDWSLILSQTYDFTVSGNQLEILRDNGTYRDVYKLTK